MTKTTDLFAIASCLVAMSCVGSLDSGNGSPGEGSGSTGGSNDGSGSGSGTGSGTSDPLNAVTDPLSATLGFKTGQAQHDALCARKLGGAGAKAFCASATQPAIASVVALQQLVGLAFQAGNNANGRNGNPAFVLTGHSTSLVTHFTSAITPRVIIFTPPNSTGRVGTPNPLASFTAIGFVR